MDELSNPYRPPGPETIVHDAAAAPAEPEDWNDVPLWRRGYVCFGLLVAMLVLTVLSYTSPELVPISLALSIGGLAYSVLLSQVAVYHAPVAADDGLRAWEPLEKAAALTLSTILFCVNAFFATSYVNDRYVAPFPYTAATPVERPAAEVL